jgi:tRNA(fMet)-specific endonuclease VapC
MKLMLDTNVCIYVIKEHPASVVERFTSLPVGDVGISVITLAELEYGVSKSSRPARNREALDLFISPLDVASFDRQATAIYGKLRTVPERKGQPIGSMDLLIAAHAISLDVRLITHNVKEFRRVPGLRIEDWA